MYLNSGMIENCTAISRDPTLWSYHGDSDLYEFSLFAYGWRSITHREG